MNIVQKRFFFLNILLVPFQVIASLAVYFVLILASGTANFWDKLGVGVGVFIVSSRIALVVFVLGLVVEVFMKYKKIDLFSNTLLLVQILSAVAIIYQIAALAP